MDLDPQFETKLGFLRWKRAVLFACEWLTIYLILLLLLYRFPAQYPATVAILGICLTITTWLDINAVEDEMGIPHSPYLIFPFAKR